MGICFPKKSKRNGFSTDSIQSSDSEINKEKEKQKENEKKNKHKTNNSNTNNGGSESHSDSNNSNIEENKQDNSKEGVLNQKNKSIRSKTTVLGNNKPKSFNKQKSKIEESPNSSQTTFQEGLESFSSASEGNSEKSFDQQKKNKKNSSNENEAKMKITNENEKGNDNELKKNIKKKNQILKIPRITSPNSNQIKLSPKFTPKKNKVIRWRKDNLIGKGSYGKVYVGFNLDSGELLAVKQIPLEKNNLKEMHELEKEVKLMDSLKHPNIVRYLGTEWTDEHLNIFLEYAPGGSLASLFKRFGKLEEPVIRIYTKQILTGLKYLHDRNIVHRDIKGANILVDSTGGVKLADFGAAKRLNAFNSEDQNSSLCGTPFWMAPEVIRKQQYGKQGDIWSLGCTVIEMLTAKHPWYTEFTEESETVTVIYKLATCTSGPDYPNNVSKECKDFLDRCLYIEPNQRARVRDLLQHPFITQQEELISKNEKSNKKTNKIRDGILINHLEISKLSETELSFQRSRINSAYLFEKRQNDMRGRMFQNLPRKSMKKKSIKDKKKNNNKIGNKKKRLKRSKSSIRKKRLLKTEILRNRRKSGQNWSVDLDFQKSGEFGTINNETLNDSDNKKYKDGKKKKKKKKKIKQLSRSQSTSHNLKIKPIIKPLIPNVIRRNTTLNKIDQSHEIIKKDLLFNQLYSNFVHNKSHQLKHKASSNSTKKRVLKKKKSCNDLNLTKNPINKKSTELYDDIVYNNYKIRKNARRKKKKKRTLSRDQEIKILKNEINKLTKRMEMRKFVNSNQDNDLKNIKNKKVFNKIFENNNELKTDNEKDKMDENEKESEFLKIKESVKEQKAETQKILERYESKKYEFEKYFNKTKN
ncbi:apoptotic signal-regulating kinase 1 [Anaeramoeba flamelloides]|uniref:Apoptotic signal-regulating kinase 1 n=1 Tax=Anaeramoeba flamelloides TaxID=1746091 RepID=A0ABQ8YQ76_9EUKA|nr:apoptotic signal-regulating kinase 1 [Anaeramoeba flamelloides]